MTTIYLVRHSKAKKFFEDYNKYESEQIKNEKLSLSEEGEQLAKKLSENSELKDIDVIYSSHYVRAISTAKYIAGNNNISLKVDERLGERKFGIDDISKLPDDFFEKQFRDWNYKLDNGESINEVYKRMNSKIEEILLEDKDKRIVIVSHGTSMSAMLSRWCIIKLNEKTKLIEIYFNNKMVFNGDWKAPELFKLEFENDNLISIKNIRE